MDGTPAWCGTSKAVEALPCGSRSSTRTDSPCSASPAARLTALVVLPTPPFWLAIHIRRVAGGGGNGGRSAPERNRTTVSAAAAIGVSTAGADVSRGTDPGPPWL